MVRGSSCRIWSRWTRSHPCRTQSRSRPRRLFKSSRLRCCKFFRCEPCVLWSRFRLFGCLLGSDVSTSLRRYMPRRSLFPRRSLHRLCFLRHRLFRSCRFGRHLVRLSHGGPPLGLPVTRRLKPTVLRWFQGGGRFGGGGES